MSCRRTGTDRVTAELEEEIVSLRVDILRLKHALAGAFGKPGEFAALGDALRASSARLPRLEAELRDAQLQSRDEPWWRGPAQAADSGKAVALPQSAAAFRRAARR